MISNRIHYQRGIAGSRADTFLLSAGKVIRGPGGGEGLMALNTVRHYPYDRLTRHSDSQVMCAGTPRWVTVGLESISIPPHNGESRRKPAVANVLVYRGVVDDDEHGEQLHQSCTRFEFLLHMGEVEEVESAYIVDGPLLITNSSGGCVWIHSLQIADKSSLRSTVADAFYQDQSEQRILRGVNELGSIGGVVITEMQLEVKREGQAESSAESVRFSALELVDKFKNVHDTIMIRGNSDWGYTYAPVGNDADSGCHQGESPSVPSKLWPFICAENTNETATPSVHTKLLAEAPGVDPMAAISRARYVVCSADGALSVYENRYNTGRRGPLSKETLATRHLPLNGQMKVSKLWCFGFTVCVYVHAEAAPPFVLVFSAPDLHMLLELRGCHDMHLMPPSYTTVLGSFGKGEEEGALMCMVDRETDNGAVSTVAVPISMPSTAGVTVFRKNGSPRMCPAGTAANLLSIYEGGSSPEGGSKGKGKFKGKSKSEGKSGTHRGAAAKKKRSFPDPSTTEAFVSPITASTAPGDPPASVIRALKSRLSALHAVSRQLQLQEQGWKLKLRGLRACLAQAQRGSPDSTTSAAGMALMLHDHQRVFPPSPGEEEAPPASSALPSHHPSNTARRKEAQGQMQVLSALCLPHAPSLSVTMLLRVRNDTALPIFGLSLVASCLRASAAASANGASSSSNGSDLASDSPVTPVLAARSEAWMTLRVQLSHDLFVGMASTTSAVADAGGGDGRVLLVITLLYTGSDPAHTSSSASLQAAAEALMVDPGGAVQAVAQGWVPSFSSRLSRTACVASMSLEDMHWCSPPSPSLFTSTSTHTGSGAMTGGVEGQGREEGTPLLSRARERMAISRAAALARLQAVGCIVARLPPLEPETVPMSTHKQGGKTFDNSAMDIDLDGSGEENGDYAGSWLYWQLVAWAVDAASKAELEAGVGAGGAEEKRQGVIGGGALYYGYCPSVEVLLAKISDKGRVGKTGKIGKDWSSPGSAFQIAVKYMRESRVANVAVAPAAGSGEGEGEGKSEGEDEGEGRKAALLHQVTRLLTVATELHPFLPPAPGTAPLKPFYSTHAHDLVLEAVTEPAEAETETGTEVEVALGRLVAPAHPPQAQTHGASLSAGLHGLQRALQASSIDDGEGGAATLHLRAVCDTEGALDSIGAAARYISLELRRLGTALRDRRALLQRQRQQPSSSSSSSSSLRGDESAFSSLTNDDRSLCINAKSLKAPLEAMNPSSAAGYLQSRSRADLATAQALGGSL